MNVITPTKSVLTLKDPSSNIIPNGDTAEIDTTAFFITVKDPTRTSTTPRAIPFRYCQRTRRRAIRVMVRPSRRATPTGVFSERRLPLWWPSQSGANKIVTQRRRIGVHKPIPDQNDSSRIFRQAFLVTLAAFPTPVYGWIPRR